MCRSLLSAIGDAQAVISAIGFNGGADSKGYEAIDNKASLFSQACRTQGTSCCISHACRGSDFLQCVSL